MILHRCKIAATGTSCAASWRSPGRAVCRARRERSASITRPCSAASTRSRPGSACACSTARRAATCLTTAGEHMLAERRAGRGRDPGARAPSARRRRAPCRQLARHHHGHAGARAARAASAGISGGLPGDRAGARHRQRLLRSVQARGGRGAAPQPASGGRHGRTQARRDRGRAVRRSRLPGGARPPGERGGACGTCPDHGRCQPRPSARDPVAGERTPRPARACCAATAGSASSPRRAPGLGSPRCRASSATGRPSSCACCPRSQRSPASSGSLTHPDLRRTARVRAFMETLARGLRGERSLLEGTAARVGPRVRLRSDRFGAAASRPARQRPPV